MKFKGESLYAGFGFIAMGITALLFLSRGVTMEAKGSVLTPAQTSIAACLMISTGIAILVIDLVNQKREK